VSRLIQQTVGRILLEQISDPRIDPAKVSVTRAEVSEDLTHAKVYVSAMGGEAEQRNALRALQHAAGHIQELVTQHVRLRFTPVLHFVPDVRFKKSLATLALIQEAMEELRADEEALDGGEPDSPVGGEGHGEG